MKLSDVHELFNSQNSSIIVSPEGKEYVTLYPVTLVDADGKETLAGAYSYMDSGRIYVSEYTNLLEYSVKGIDPDKDTETTAWTR